MLDLLWLVPALPFAGFLALVLAGKWGSRRVVAIIGAGSVGLSAVMAALIATSFINSPPADRAFVQTLWTWMSVAGFEPEIAFHLDALSLIMMLVVTFVGFLIHLYSVEFMREEEGYRRFFAYMTLFVGSMLTLVLADNLLLLYLGWEGVGLCSYLLIGFWYQDPDNGRAARKAFIVTRVGDAALAIGLFVLFNNLGTLQIQELTQRATQQWAVGSGLAVVAAALLLGGALGKSAQLPLQVWLPDAMAGPSPVSALIHAATMVTAGVYLIARTHALFALAPVVQSSVAIIGTATLLIASFSALAQWNIKRVLAYSTISQIGYMFLALGVGAWSAAIFHFMTHAFFKALLFLGAGVIILRLDHEHDMSKMGGLRKELPLTFGTFLVGAASLAALPIVTAGFYSKDLILWDALSSQAGSPWLWAAGLLGAFLTSVYIFRVVFLTFFGEAKPLVKQASPLGRPGLPIMIPLLVLAILSVVGGLVELPTTLGNRPLFSDFLHSVLPPVSTVRAATLTELMTEIVSGLISLGGIGIAYLLILRLPHYNEMLGQSRIGAVVRRFWFAGWGFDWLYNQFIVRPFVWLARVDKDDLIDAFYQWIAWVNKALHHLLSRTQTGQLRRYAMGVAIGAVITIAVVVLL
jgi:NADH-quinone oxidoreductase subunit L